MFELRFIEISPRNDPSRTAKFLQFRTKDKHVESSTTTPEPLAWSDWKEVPLVKNDESS